MTEPPKFTGKKREITITGYLLPMKDEQPVFIDVPGMTASVVVLFSTRAALDRAVAQVPSLVYDRLVRIDNGRGFLQSIPNDGTVEIIIDPTIENGNTRFQKLFRD